MRFREFIYQPEDIAVNQGDVFDIELDDIVLETVVSAVLEDGVLVEMDAVGLSYLTKFQLEEAEYQGRSVPLGKPMKGDVKKSKVYVKGPSGRIVKVNFGDKKMKIKKSNPARRKSFRARHNCANPGPRHKARYWSCRAW
jgi:hypothetical protein